MKKSVNVHKNFVKKELDKKNHKKILKESYRIFSEFVEKTVLIRKLVRFLSFEKPY